MRRRVILSLWSYPKDTGDDDELSRDLLPFALQEYKKALGRYLIAGRPFGSSDLAMLLWFTFDQQTRLN